MKRLLVIAAAAAGLVFAAVPAVKAELVTIYGPVYVSKAKHDHHNHHRHDAEKSRKSHEDEHESEFTFTAPVPGAGIIVVTNGGVAGKKGRVSSAKIEFNDEKLMTERDFNKKVGTVTFPVVLNAENELEVELKGCKDCELEIYVLGERSLPTRALPQRTAFPAF